MKFTEIFWHDSQLIKINIKYDIAILKIWNDAMQKNLLVRCSGLVGITDLCIWDDTIIHSANLYSVNDADNEFLRKLFKSYDRNYDYGGRILNNGLLELKIKLVNDISFSVYCQEIDIVEPKHLKRHFKRSN